MHPAHRSAAQVASGVGCTAALLAGCRHQAREHARIASLPGIEPPPAMWSAAATVARAEPLAAMDASTFTVRPFTRMSPGNVRRLRLVVGDVTRRPRDEPATVRRALLFPGRQPAHRRAARCRRTGQTPGARCTARGIRGHPISACTGVGRTNGRHNDKSGERMRSPPSTTPARRRACSRPTTRAGPQYRGYVGDGNVPPPRGIGSAPPGTPPIGHPPPMRPRRRGWSRSQ